MLLNQLTRKFGKLPAPIHARIEAASTQELDRWGERVLSASVLHDVFDD